MKLSTYKLSSLRISAKNSAIKIQNNHHIKTYKFHQKLCLQYDREVQSSTSFHFAVVSYIKNKSFLITQRKIQFYKLRVGLYLAKNTLTISWQNKVYGDIIQILISIYLSSQRILRNELISGFIMFLNSQITMHFNLIFI